MRFWSGSEELQAADQPSTEDVPEAAGPRAWQAAGAGRDSQVHGGQVGAEGGQAGGQGRPVPAHTRLLSGQASGRKLLQNNDVNCLQSVHSNLCEKNSLLYTLLQHGESLKN